MQAEDPPREEVLREPSVPPHQGLRDTGWDEVDEASAQSFPGSDPPPWWTGPRAHGDA